MAATLQQQPGAPPSSVSQLRELQEAVASLQAAALDSDRQAAAALAAAADHDAQARAAIVDAYGRRLDRLATLLRQYDSHMQQALAALGLAPGSDDGDRQDALTGLAEGLLQLEQQLEAVALGGTADAPTDDALLLLAGSVELAARAAVAGPAAILSELQARIEADIAAVDSWPALLPLPEVAGGSSASASEGPLSAAFHKLHLEQKEGWQAAHARRQQLDKLRAEVVAAQAALAASGSDGAEAAECTRLAAQQAGLRAELDSLDRSRRAAEEGSAAAAQRGQQVAAQRAGVAALEAREAAVDASVRALCCADSRVMRQWRQGTWRAQEVVESGVLSQRQPLVEVSQQLLDAQRQELAAFRRQAGQQCAAAACATEAAPAGPTAAAAQLLDPLASLKTEQHAAALLAAAAGELTELQPVVQQWADLAAAADAKLSEQRQAAAELQGRVGELQEEGGATFVQLREAAVAAAEGEALVASARQVLTEWWTTPAVTATPWVKREGKSAEEWLRLLGNQQRLLRQREAFTDASNHRRRA